MDRCPILRSCQWLNAMLLAATTARAADDDVLHAPSPPPQNVQVMIAEPQALDVETIVFGRDIVGGKDRFDKSIADAVEEACRGYILPQQVRHRLERAAQVDKSRLIHKMQELRTQSEQAGPGIRQQKPIMSQLQVLRRQQANLLDRDSFFAKSRKILLASVPSIDREMTADKMKRSRHRSNVEKALQVIGRHSFVADEQYERFAEDVFEKTLPDEPFEDRDLVMVKYRIGTMPRSELEPLFVKQEWSRVSKILARFHESRRLLIIEGLLPGKQEIEQPVLVEREARTVRVLPPTVVIQRANEPQIPAGNRAAPIVDPAFLLTRHRANIDSAVRAVERQIHLRPEQHTALTELLLKEVQPPRVFGNFDDLVVQYAFSQLSDDQLKPLFDEDQWPKVLQEFARIDQYRPMLSTHGLINKPSTRQFPERLTENSLVSTPADGTLPANPRKD